VRDISDGGLRFRVIDPLQESEQVHFWFVANFSRIGGAGDLVWMDETKKTGGLRFTQLSEESREQIRSWLHESNLRPRIGEDPTPDVAATGASPLSNQSDPCTVPALACLIHQRKEYARPREFGRPRSMEAASIGVSLGC
jgi:hypothetical protein